MRRTRVVHGFRRRLALLIDFDAGEPAEEKAGLDVRAERIACDAKGSHLRPTDNCVGVNALGFVVPPPVRDSGRHERDLR